MLKRIAVLHQGNNAGSASFAENVAREFERVDLKADVDDAWSTNAVEIARNADLIVCVGGDGTVLRAARVALPNSAPILGVNMGRLGFLTTLSPADFFHSFERLVAGEWQIQERLMVRASVAQSDGQSLGPYHALNDIVASRQSPGRPVYVDVRIDGAKVANYRCDGIIVATPTGSTGYSLSAGGPILDPTEHHLVLTPVAAHLALGSSIVLARTSVIDLIVTSDHGATLSVDGQDEVMVGGTTRIKVDASEHITRFVMFGPPSSFFGDLAERFELQLSSATQSRA